MKFDSLENGQLSRKSDKVDQVEEELISISMVRHNKSLKSINLNICIITFVLYFRLWRQEM